MGEGGNPPVVRLVDPADPNIGDPYVYGAERIFTASVDQIATLEFYLDDTLMQTFPNVTEASQPFQIPLLGVHMVRVVARNENGSGENYWTWSIFVTPPEITRIDPAEPEVTDKVNASRLFKARSNQYAIIRFYLDGELKQESPVPTQNASYRHEPAPLGEHVVSVVATNTNGSGQNHWDWNVKECFSEGATKCIGYDLFECVNGRWTLKEANSVQCGYPITPVLPTDCEATHESEIALCMLEQNTIHTSSCVNCRKGRLKAYSVAIPGVALCPSFGGSCWAECCFSTDPVSLPQQFHIIVCIKMNGRVYMSVGGIEASLKVFVEIPTLNISETIFEEDLCQQHGHPLPQINEKIWNHEIIYRSTSVYNVGGGLHRVKVRVRGRAVTATAGDDDIHEGSCVSAEFNEDFAGDGYVEIIGVYVKEY